MEDLEDPDRLEPFLRHIVPDARIVPDVKDEDQQEEEKAIETDRKSTRLNSSHSSISYAVFCLKKKKKKKKKKNKKKKQKKKKQKKTRKNTLKKINIKLRKTSKKNNTAIGNKTNTRRDIDINET